MAITPMAFTPTDGWENATAFPTNPDTEAAARAMLQELHTQTKTFINALITAYAATGESPGAGEIGVGSISGLTAADVQAAIAELLGKFANYVAATAIEQTLTSSESKIPSSAAVSAAMVAGGLGDMLSSVYAQTEAGKVDTALNAEKLGNVTAASYATKEYVDSAIPAVPTTVSELTNDSEYQTESGGVASWIASDGTQFLLKGICTQLEYEADSENPDRARTAYLVPLE